MSETKWTPGPWRVDYQNEDNPDDERLAVFSAAYSDETPGICAGTKAWPLIREDADLIAAAPDLYAALESAESVLTHHGFPDNAQSVLAAARAALRKARGEEP